MKVTHDYYYFIDYFPLFITNYKGLTVLEKKKPFFTVVLRIISNNNNIYLFFEFKNDLINNKKKKIESTRRGVNRCKSSTERLDIRIIKKSTYLYVFYAITTR